MSIDTPAVFLKYPFTGRSLCSALARLNINVHKMRGLEECFGWETKKRTNHVSFDAGTLSKLEIVYANLSSALDVGPSVANVSDLPLAMRKSVHDVVKAASKYQVPRPDNCGPKYVNRPWLPSAPKLGVVPDTLHKPQFKASIARSPT
jgi:hypothetical protein